MPKIENTTDKDITADTGHKIPAGKSLTCTEATLKRIASEPYIAAKFDCMDLVVTGDAPKARITRKAIAKMGEGKVIELLDAHGVEKADLADKPIEDLRALLIGVMFTDL